MAENVQCAICEVEVHPAFTVLVPAPNRQLQRACLGCRNRIFQELAAANAPRPDGGR